MVEISYANASYIVTSVNKINLELKLIILEQGAAYEHSLAYYGYNLHNDFLDGTVSKTFKICWTRSEQK